MPQSRRYKSTKRKSQKNSFSHNLPRNRANKRRSSRNRFWNFFKFDVQLFQRAVFLISVLAFFAIFIQIINQVQAESTEIQEQSVSIRPYANIYPIEEEARSFLNVKPETESQNFNSVENNGSDSLETQLETQSAENAATQIVEIPNLELNAVFEDYTVKSGDTLSSIAAENSTTVVAIVDANQIENDSVLQVGQVLKIPQSN